MIPRLLKLAWPVSVARLSIMLMGLTDAIMVGQFSTQELAYEALGWAPTAIALVASVGLMSGVQVLVARHFGANDLEAAGQTFRRGLVYGSWIVGLAALLIFVGAEQALTVTTNNPELAKGAAHVSRVLALGLPFHIAFAVASFFLEAINRPRAGMVILLLANVVNLAGNYVLVFGAGDIPAMGAVGSAWATFIARGFALAAIIGYCLFLLPDRAAFKLLTPAPPNPRESHEMRNLGYAAGLSQVLEVGAFASMNFIAGRISAQAVAAYTIALNVSALVFMSCLGIAAATGILIAQAEGRNGVDEERRALVVGTWVTIGFTGICALITLIFAPWIGRAYSNDAALLLEVAPLLVLAAVFFVPDGLQATFSQALRSGGIVWFPTASHLVAYLVVMVPCGYWLALHLGHGARGLIEAILIASTVSALGLGARAYWWHKYEAGQKKAAPGPFILPH